MDIHTHSVIDILHQRIILEKLALRPDYILIISYRRTGLRILRRHLMHLGCCLINQRKHHIKRNTMLLKKLGTDGITMIHKIAGKDGREMQILASLARQTVNPMAQLRSQRLDGSCLLFARTLYKTRYLLEGDTLLPGEPAV